MHPITRSDPGHFLAPLAVFGRGDTGLSPFSQTGERQAASLQGNPISAIVSDGQFVWGPNVGEFSVAEFLKSIDSPLLPYSDDIALWSSYSSVNPKVLLTLLEMQHRLVTQSQSQMSSEQIQTAISSSAVDLAQAFYQHLYSVGPRGSDRTALPQVLKTADDQLVFTDPEVPSASFAVAALLAQDMNQSALASAFSTQGTDSFSSVFGSMFPSTDPLSTTNQINAESAPPADLLQLPFPQGATWVSSGPHSWNGDSTPPFSSIDFFLRGGSCSAPPFYYSTASASGTAQRPSNYSCWLEINHGGGWKTSYYHLRNTFDGGAIDRNATVGSIACQTCAGGYATGPHVHWSLKYNGAYVSLEGIKLSGWTVHVGADAYSSGSMTRGGVTLSPYDSVLNDYPTYYPSGQHSLRFYGNGTNDIDRVKIPVDDPTNSNPGPPADVGSTDFTIEWWMKAAPAQNQSAPISCGANYNWIYGNTLLDRDRYNQVRTYGVSMAGGRIAFGLTGNGTGSYTLCGTSRVDDGLWHHVAVERRRSDGHLWIFVDGQLDASHDGPNGDISYPDNGVPRNYCGPAGDEPCTNDPFLVVAAEKHGVGPTYPSFSGWIDEIRLSHVLRYNSSFSPPDSSFVTDGNTVALYHFDEGAGNQINDVSGFPGGPSNGFRKYGGTPAGPTWSLENPWSTSQPPVTYLMTEVTNLPELDLSLDGSQWLVRMKPTANGPTGFPFYFVVWLQVPNTWELPWARQGGFNSAFSSDVLTKSQAALAWMIHDSSCNVGGAAPEGYKWRAWIGPLQRLPQPSVRNDALVNLRGGIRYPASAGSQGQMLVVSGFGRDTDAIAGPDEFHCITSAGSGY
ncbi:MAG: LamG-like jellyroll fold domain-containing protein [Anaerolineales bacterium]